jgi:hypothetical protein
MTHLAGQGQSFVMVALSLVVRLPPDCQIGQIEKQPTDIFSVSEFPR